MGRCPPGLFCVHPRRHHATLASIHSRCARPFNATPSTLRPHARCPFDLAARHPHSTGAWLTTRLSASTHLLAFVLQIDENSGIRVDANGNTQVEPVAGASASGDAAIPSTEGGGPAGQVGPIFRRAEVCCPASCNHLASLLLMDVGMQSHRGVLPRIMQSSRYIVTVGCWYAVAQRCADPRHARAPPAPCAPRVRPVYTPCGLSLCHACRL